MAEIQEATLGALSSFVLAVLGQSRQTWPIVGIRELVYGGKGR